jgi:hypothetical protein
MKNSRQARAVGSKGPAQCILLVFLAAAILTAGCAQGKARVRPWATAMTVRPHLPAAVPGYTPEPPEFSAPDLPWDFPPPPSPLTVVHQPPRPRVPMTQAPSESPEGRKAAAPSLAPLLSTQEVAEAQRQMNESAAAAQRHLDAAKGRSLNAGQNDLVSKVTSFLEESKGAAREGDWTRARNLAKKAQVLAEELAATL